MIRSESERKTPPAPATHEETYVLGGFTCPNCGYALTPFIEMRTGVEEVTEGTGPPCCASSTPPPSSTPRDRDLGSVEGGGTFSPCPACGGVRTYAGSDCPECGWLWTPADTERVDPAPTSEPVSKKEYVCYLCKKTVLADGLPEGWVCGVWSGQPYCIACKPYEGE